MTMSNYNRKPALAPRFVQSGVFAASPLTLFDVGVSGGFDMVWEAFGESVRAWGFDPLITEIERLRAEAKPGQVFEAALVGCPSFRLHHPAEKWWTPAARANHSYERSSAVWAQGVAKHDWIKEEYNHGAEIQLTDRLISIDQYCADNDIGTVDVLKIDTDGGDYEVLHGADRMLREGGILAVQVEAQFQGAVLPEANLFSNIDLFLRDRGFTLFDLDLWRYSKASLPRPFYYDIPAQTVRGQVLWGEALYLRDQGDPDYETKWPSMTISPMTVLKQAALFDLFSLQDCAVELLEKYKAQVETIPGMNIQELIESMLPAVDGRRVTHREFMEHCAAQVRQGRLRHLPKQEA